MEEAQNKNINSKETFIPIPLLVCPNCVKRIPILHLEKEKMYETKSITFQCSCFKGKKTVSLRRFIESLSNQSAQQQVDHLISPSEINVQCNQHSKLFSYYCKQCLVDICVDCSVSHQHHPYICLRSVEIEEQTNVFEEAKALGRRLTNELIQLIDQKLNSLQHLEANNEVQQEIEKVTKMKNDINEHLETNEAINDDLRLLYQSISKTALAFKHYLSYQLMALELISVDSILFIPSFFFDESIEIVYRSFDDVIKHLKSSFILYHSPLNECTEVNTGKCIQLNCLVQLLDGRLALGYDEGIIKLWNISTLTSSEDTFVKLKGQYCIICLLQLLDGRLVSGGDNLSIQMWDLTVNKCIATFDAPMFSYILRYYSIRCLVELRDGTLVACSEERTERWNTKTYCRLETSTQLHFTNVVELIDKRLASYKSSNIILWRFEDKAGILTLEGHKENINCLLQLSEGTLASSSDDKSIKLWNPETQQCIATLLGHPGKVHCLIQLKDGELASSSDDKTIKLWHRTTHQCIATYSLAWRAFISCFVQLTDERLVADNCNGFVGVWDNHFFSY